MKPPKDPRRDLIAHAATLTTALGGVALLVNEPLGRTLDAARAQLNTDLADLAVTQPAVAAPSLNGPLPRAEVFNAFASASVDPSRAHETIARLASRERVMIDRVEPRGGAKSDKDKGGSHSFGLSISAHGTYDSIVRFLAALEREAGFTAVTGATLSPASGSGPSRAVRAVIDTTHARFDARPKNADQPAQHHASAEQHK